MRNIEISKFCGGITNTSVSETIKLEQAINEMASEKYKDRINLLRNESKEKRYKELKRKLDYYVFSAICDKRNSNEIKQLTGLICGDVDDLESKKHAIEVKDRLSKDECILAAWLSPSGKGIKFLTSYDTKCDFSNAWKSMEEYLRKKHLIKVDPACKDTVRACFVSHDDSIYFNWNAKPIKVEKKKTQVSDKKVIESTAMKVDKKELMDCVSWIEKNNVNIVEKYNEWINVGFAIAGSHGLEGIEAYHRISQMSAKYDSIECEKKYSQLCRTVKKDGIPLSYLFYKSGWKKPQGSHQVKHHTILDYVYKVGLRFNVIKNQLEYKNGEMFSDRHLNTMLQNFRLSSLPKLTKTYLCEVIESNFVPTFNPFEEWKYRLMEIETDDSEILKFLKSFKYKYKGSLLQNLIIRWLYQIPATIAGKQPVDLMLVLTGAQGIGKTEMIQRLFPNELSDYVNVTGHKQEKDAIIEMSQNLILLDDEMAGKTRKSVESMKSSLSRKQIKERIPYDKFPTLMKRVAVYAGTSNHSDILFDNTGNRRLIPVELISRDFEIFDSINLDKFWAYFFQGWEKDKSLHLITKKERQWLMSHSDKYQVSNPYEDYINMCFTKSNENEPSVSFLSTTEIRDVIYKECGEKLNYITLGKQLQSMGFTKESKRVDGRSKKGYYVITKKSDFGIDQDLVKTSYWN